MKSVTIAGHPDCNLTYVQETVQKAHLKAEVAVYLGELTALAARFADDSEAFLILVYEEPWIVVGRAMMAVSTNAMPEPERLLDKWKSDGLVMLSLATREVGRCILVSASRAEGDPKAILALLSDTLDADEGSGRTEVGVNIPSGRHFDFSPLECRLAISSVSHDIEAKEILEELDSCSHVGRNLVQAQAATARAAWIEYREHTEHSKALRDASIAKSNELQAIASDNLNLQERLAELSGKLSDAISDRDHHKDQIAVAMSIAEASRSDVERLRNQYDQLSNDAESLLVHLHAAHLEGEGFLERCEASDIERRSLVAKLAEAQREFVNVKALADASRAEQALLQQQVAIHADELRRLGLEVEKLRAEKADLEARCKQLDDIGSLSHSLRGERDTARIAVLQLRSRVTQLESDVAQGGAQLDKALTACSQLSSFWIEHQPEEVYVDLRREINGTNWYAAEADGRWTGPACESTIVIPALRQGSYSLRVILVGAISPMASAGLSIKINDKNVELTFNRAKHPRIGSAMFHSPPSSDGDWKISIVVPGVQSPSESGATDQRTLGVRVAAIGLKWIPESRHGS